MKRLLLTFFLLTVMVYAADGPLVLTGFRGLNTIDGDLVVEKAYCRIANNVDFSKGGKNVIAKRDGYALVDTVPAADSIVSMFVYNRLDGNKHMVVVRDDSGDATWPSYTGTVFKTTINSASMDSLTTITNHWPIVQPSSFCTFRDNLLGVNGTSFGLLHRNNITREFPLRSPAEPKIIPLKKTGNLNGDMYYIIRSATTSALFDTIGGVIGWWTYVPDTACRKSGYLSRPVRVTNGQIALTGFTWHARDSINTDTPIVIYIYRVPQSALPITGATKAYKLPYADWRAWMSPNELAAYSFVDTFSDAQLVGQDSVSVFGYPYMAVKDAGGLGFYNQHGSPAYLSCDTGTGILSGIWHDTGSALVDTLLIKGWAYTYTYIDTMTGLESDTSPALWIMRDGTKERGYKIRLPRADSSRTGLRINLYRAPICTYKYDTNWFSTWSYIWSTDTGLFDKFKSYFNIKSPSDTGFDKPPETDNGPSPWLRINRYRPRVSGLTDTFLLGKFFLREQLTVITDSNRLYYDTLHFDSLRKVPQTFRKNFPPYFMEQIQMVNNRMMVLANGNVYYSNLDSVGEFGLFNFKVLSNNDGDRITAMFPVRQAIRVFKNQSNWNLYGPTLFPELVGHWGCIAPRSVASGENGTFYLANEGVYFEEEGPTLERTVQAGLVSAPLASFKNATTIMKQKAVGRYLPAQRKYILSMGDTAFVFDVISQAWSTFTNFSFGDAVLYDTGAVNKYYPGGTFYFAGRGSKYIYRYPSGTTDAGGYPYMTYQTVPLWSGFSQNQALSIGVVTHGVDISSLLQYNFIGDTNINLASNYLDSMQTGRRKERVTPFSSFKASLTLYTAINMFNAGSIDAIVVETQPVSEYGDR